MRRSTHLVCWAVVVLAVCGWTRAQGAAKTPKPPRTGRYSVQMFQGKTELCWIAVWPPSNYTDGTPIPPGTKVKVKMYRSVDGRKTYTTKNVSIVGMGEGFVGQGEKDPRKKRWIDCKLKTPVDNKKPFAVWLAASVIVNGVESQAVNRFLTFCYRDRAGRPRLVRYETTDITGVGVDDEPARPLPQELPGIWSDGEFVLREISAHVERMPTQKDREACRKNIPNLTKMKNKPLPMSINIKEIDVVGAPGLRGNPVNPLQAKKIHFPGKLTITIVNPLTKKSDTSDPMGFMYNYRDRSIRFEYRNNEKGKYPTVSLTRFGGHFFQTATHYSVHGTWKSSWMVKGKETLEMEGTWSGKKRKK